MQHVIKLSIVAGERTCASEPGTFCRFLLTSHFGQRFRCQIFDDPDTCVKSGLVEVDGWLRRHPKCLEAVEQNTPKQASIIDNRGASIRQQITIGANSSSDERRDHMYVHVRFK